MAFAKLLELYTRELNATGSSSVNTELELRFTIRSIDEYKRLLAGIIHDAETSYVSYTVAIIKRDKAIGQAKHTVQMKQFPGQKNISSAPSTPDKIATREYSSVDGKMIKGEMLTYSSKQRLGLASVDNEFVPYRLSISSEAAAPGFPIELFTILRMKLRLSIITSKYPDWRFDFTLVDEMTSLTPEFPKRRDSLFKPGLNVDNFVSSAPFGSAKHTEFEIEYIGARGFPITSSEIYNLIDYVRRSGNFNIATGAAYQDAIYEIAKLLYPPGKAANYRSKLGRKALGPSVIGLTKESYQKDILPRIVGSRATIKLDGEGVIGAIIGDTVHAVGGSLYESKSVKMPSGPVVYDCELYEGKQYVFDVYVFEGKNLIDTADMSVRETYIPKVVALLGDIAVAKTHTVLTENYGDQLSALWQSRDSKIRADGIIFDNVYKWKPVEHLTIDFLTMRESPDSQENKYLLFVGINRSQSRQYNIRPVVGYNKIFSGRTFHDYYPIQFAPGDKPDAYLFTAPETHSHDLHGHICEYAWNDGSWKFSRIREDRDTEVARGSYFGNNIAVAIATWNSIHDPLTFDMLCGSVEMLESKSTPGYFGTTDQKYESANRFSSFVKEQSLKPFSGLSWVIDLASGRGADIGRWSRLGIKNALCVDNDSEALKELLTRHVGNQRRLHHYKLNIATMQIDLNKPHIENTRVMRAAAPGMPKVPLAVCNMAIHYMCESDASIWNFVMLVDSLLEVGGHFVFTCYNGARIYDLLTEKEQIDLLSGTDVKYSIKRVFKPGPFKNYGQKIEPLLGCAGGRYVSEFLVNINYLVKMFKHRGFKLVTQVCFNSMLSVFSVDNLDVYDKLDDADHDNLGLYDYVVLQKTEAVGRESEDKRPDDLTSVITLPGKEIGESIVPADIAAAMRNINAPPLEVIPTKDIRASLKLPDFISDNISMGKVKIIVQPNRKFPGPPKMRKDGVAGKKPTMRELAIGDRVVINDVFEVVVEDLAIVSAADHIPDRFTIAELSTTATTRDEWLKEFSSAQPEHVGFELMAIKVRKL